MARGNTGYSVTFRCIDPGVQLPLPTEIWHGDLADWPVLKRELLNFRSELTAAGHETWNSHSGEHDDLVIATALCVGGLGDDAIPYGGLLRHYGIEAGVMGSERFCIGVDLGQAVDPTAICVMSRI